MSSLRSVNAGRLADSPTGPTAIGKAPVEHAEVRAPGPRTGVKGDGRGSGLVGDQIGDGRHHGGDEQAVYAFAGEELDHWAALLGRPLPDGTFGENLTTDGLDVDGAELGEVWRIGGVELVVTAPRIPCRTFADWMGERGWVRTFTQRGRAGTYLSVRTPGTIRPGDRIDVERPGHGVTVAEAFRALTTERALLPGLLRAGDSITGTLRESAEKARSAQDAG